MATTFQTVSDEMALTDWSVSNAPATRPTEARQDRPNLLGLATAVLAGAAMLAAVLYLLPPGVH